LSSFFKEWLLLIMVISKCVRTLFRNILFLNLIFFIFLNYFDILKLKIIFLKIKIIF
jgi:hypothetical protein